MVGEFGGNDYGSTIFSFRPLEEVHALVPHVVGAIARGVEELIAEGAVDLVVPGLLPTGCFPMFLSTFSDKPAAAYGPRSGCVKELNTLSWVHNAALRRKVEELRARHPGVRIVYADYYTPAIQFVLHAEKYGESPFPSPSPDRCRLLRWPRLWSRQFASTVVAASSVVRFLTATWTGADTRDHHQSTSLLFLGKRFKTP